MLRLPPSLIPVARGLPGCGWVLARAFTPAWAAPALWLPYTGQLAAARALGGLATHANDHARAVAVLRPTAWAPRILMGLGAAAGMVALFGLLRVTADTYIELFDVSTLRGATPLFLLPAWLVAAGLTLAWSVRHNAGRPHPQPEGTVRITSLAAHPTSRGAGAELGQALCALADEQQVTLDLTARTDDLVGLYARAGFTQPDPGTRWVIRHPQPASRPPSHVEGGSCITRRPRYSLSTCQRNPRLTGPRSGTSSIPDHE